MVTFIEVKPILSDEAKVKLLALAKIENQEVNSDLYIADIDKALSSYNIRFKSTTKEPSHSESIELIISITRLIEKLNSKIQQLQNDPNIIYSIDKQMLLRHLKVNPTYQINSTKHIEYPTEELLNRHSKNINELNDVLKDCVKDPKLISKVGRPKKDIRNFLIRDIANIFDKHVKKPALTVDGVFEKTLKLCFEEVEEYFEDVHKLALNALKKTKMQKPTANPS